MSFQNKMFFKMLPKHFIQAWRYFSLRNTWKAKEIRYEEFYTVDLFVDIKVDIDDTDKYRFMKYEI